MHIPTTPKHAHVTHVVISGKSGQHTKQCTHNTKHTHTHTSSNQHHQREERVCLICQHEDETSMIATGMWCDRPPAGYEGVYLNHVTMGERVRGKCV